MADNHIIAESCEGEADKPKAEPLLRNRPIACQLLPSFSEACKLVSSAYSCLVLQTHRRHLALSPRYLNKKRSGIQEQLNTELLKYSSRLSGVPVAYDNLKIVGELGDIHDDAGFIHLNIQVDFVIFQPQEGERLVGVVNKVAPSHIGCLVHGCFNASIPRPFKMPVEAWQYIGVNIGDHIEFEVFRLDSDAVGVFCIRGKMDKKMEADAIEKLNEAIKVNEATKEQTTDDSPAADPENAAEDVAETVIPEETPKKKSKKRALKDTLLQDVPQNPEGSVEINTTLEETPKKKSKKRKHHDLNSQTDFPEVDASTENIPVVDTAVEHLDQSVDSISQKARKKKKRHDQLPSVDIDNNIRVEEISVLSLDESLIPSSQEQPKKSKKKKHKDKSEQGPDESLQNGITEVPTFTEDTTLEALRAETDIVVENIKKKHKKKHKHSSVEDSILESMNGGADITSQESLSSDPTVHQEIPKQKKHKRKHHVDVLAGTDVGVINSNDLPADSQQFAEPKAKKKRKE